MIKRRRIAVLGVLAVAAASIFALPASSASAADQTYTNACRNTAQTANWDQVNVTMGGTSPATAVTGSNYTLSNIHETIAVPGAIFVAGYNLGLLTTGVNNIPTDFTSVIDAANTTQLSQTTNTVSQTLSTTITDPDGVPGSGDETATDASATVTFADQTWTAGAAGTTSDFAEHNDPAVTPVAGGGIRTNSSLAGGAIHVQFRCTSGTVAGANPGVPTFTNAPSFTSTANVAPPAPTVTALNPTHGPAAGGNTVTITGTDFTGATAVNFGANAATGVTVVNATTITATAPAGTAGTTVDVTVTTPSGTSPTAGTGNDYTYDAANVAPTANAGPDQSVNELTLVTLDGTGSTDPDGTIASYAWTQSGGPAVTLSDPSAAMPTFTAPDVAAPTDLTFDLTVTDNNGATSAPDSVTITVNPVVAPPSNITINDIAVTEGNSGTTAATFTVSLSGPQADPVTVDFATADGTATAPTDYTSNSGTVTFAPGVTSQPVTVLVNGDTTFEPNETFFVNLSNASSNGNITDAQGQATIVNDDAAPPVVDVATDVIVNGPVSHTKTSKSFVLKVSNLGNSPQTITAADVTAGVTVDGTETDNVSCSGLPVTLGPGASKRLKCVWSYDSTLVGGEALVFHAQVSVAGDSNTGNDSDTASVTAK
jgi:hypothetical protein